MSFESENDPDTPAYQAVVYFNEFPEIDLQELSVIIDNLDPEEGELCEITNGEDSETEGLRLWSFALTLGEMTAMVMIHSVPSPSPELIERSRLIEEMKADLREHKCFALVSVMGGDDLAGIELVLVLHKVGMALVQFGATGMTLLTNDQTYPAGLLQDILEGEFKDAEDEEESFDDQIARLAEEGNPVAAMMQNIMDASRTLEDKADEEEEEEEEEEQQEAEEEVDSIFAAMRHMGEPFEMLGGIVLLPGHICGISEPGVRVLVTRGFAQCGVPDLYYVSVDPDEDVGEVAGMFQNAFHYMMENGPVIQAGHSMGVDENVAFRFTEPDQDVNLPFDTWELLAVERG